jgi:hypothetical protein
MTTISIVGSGNMATASAPARPSTATPSSS